MICFWEDDATQLRFPQLPDATNVVSLAQAQQNYAKFGAIEERFAGDVRKPGADDVLDPGFRPISGDDPFEADATEDAGGPSDATALYYWRPTYWRSAASKPA
jgi:hypothetical protein